jgi:hypothetical protein
MTRSKTERSTKYLELRGIHLGHFITRLLSYFKLLEGVKVKFYFIISMRSM